MRHLRATTIGISVVLAGSLGCTASDRGDPLSPDASSSGNNMSTPGGGGGPGGGGSDANFGFDAGSTPGPGPDQGGGSTDGGQGAMAGSDLPCDVQQVVQDNCLRCHGEPTQFGAPMPLVTHEDFTASSPTYDMPVAKAVRQRINSESNPMPPAPNDPLSDQELATMNDWIDNGYSASNETCESTGGSDGGTGNGIQTGQCEGKIYELRAHAGQSADNTDPYEAPVDQNTTDRYECFYFKAPWGSENVQGLSFKPLIDNSKVLHHWLLYANPNAPGVSPGSHSSCGGVHGNDSLLAGWAPGGQAWVMPEDVGLKMPHGDNARLTLEIHYNNSAGVSDTKDRSGVEICTTADHREHTASVHWLGTENIVIPPDGQHSASSTCDPQLSQKAHIVGYTPHMHKIGTHFKGTIIRQDGTEEVFHDRSFNFENQATYFKDLVVNPGDRIRTTCTWNNPRTAGNGQVCFGQASADEMCYNFIIAYPAGSLANPLMNGFTTSTNSCVTSSLQAGINTFGCAEGL